MHGQVLVGKSANLAIQRECPENQACCIVDASSTHVAEFISTVATILCPILTKPMKLQPVVTLNPFCINKENHDGDHRM